jgi:hypothetical protein
MNCGNEQHLRAFHANGMVRQYAGSERLEENHPVVTNRANAGKGTGRPKTEHARVRSAGSLPTTMPAQRNLDLFICYKIQGARSLDDLDEFIALGMTFSILNFPSSTGRSIMLNVASSIDHEFHFYLSLSSLRIRY